MKVLLLSLGVFFWKISHSFSGPTAPLGFLESAPWGSGFAYNLNEAERKEIDSICSWLHKTYIRQGNQFDSICSANGRYKMKTNSYSVYQKDDLLTEATFFAEDKNIWFDTLHDVLPRFITNDGRYLLAEDYMGSGHIIFYQTRPNLKHITTAEEGFHYGWQLLPKQNLVFGLGSTQLSLYHADGTLVWERSLKVGAYDVLNYMFSIPADEKVILTGHYVAHIDNRPFEVNGSGADSLQSLEIKRIAHPVQKSYLTLLNLEGTILNQIEIPTERIWLPQIQMVSLSATEPRLAVAVFNGGLVCLDMSLGQKRWDYKYPDVNWYIRRVCFSNDGKLIAVCLRPPEPDYKKRVIELFDTQSGLPVGTSTELPGSFKSHGPPPAVAFTDDGRFLIVVSTNRKYLYRVNSER